MLTVSLHGENNFPFRKQASGIDIALADGTEDEEYLRQLGGVLPRVVQFLPEVVFYQSGVDGLGGDRLGRLRLSLEGLRRRDRMIFEMCKLHRFRLVLTLGGGYSDPIEETVKAHFSTYRAAAELFNPVATFDL